MPACNLHRQAAGDVAQVGRQVELLEARCCASVLRLSANGVARAAESNLLPFRTNASLGSILTSRCDGRLLRNGTLSAKSRSSCLRLTGLVVEIDRAAGDRDVVDGEARRLALGASGGAGRAWQGCRRCRTCRRPGASAGWPAIRCAPHRSPAPAAGSTAVRHRRRCRAICNLRPAAVGAWRCAGRSSVSSSVQGLKSILPTVTWRPSLSLAIFWIWLLAIGGTASQASSQTTSRTSNATIAASHPFVLFQRSSIHRGESVPQTPGASPETRKPGGSTRSQATGLDGGRKAHAIFSLDRKFNCSGRAGSKRLPPLGLDRRTVGLNSSGCSDLGETPEMLRQRQRRRVARRIANRDFQWTARRRFAH